MEFIYEIDQKYQNKNILIVSHGIVGSILMEVNDSDENVKNAKAYNFDFAPVPHNEDYEIDFHRPYIDQITFEKNGKKFEFVKEVFDC
jgi:isoleucyl-tRNA synthetase